MSTGLRCFPEQSCYVRSQLDLEIVTFPLSPAQGVSFRKGDLAVRHGRLLSLGGD